MQLRCRTHAVWAWPPQLSPLPFTEAVFYTERSHLIRRRKSPGVAQGGWHFKYVNAKAIKSLVNLSLRLLTTTFILPVVFLGLNWCAAPSPWAPFFTVCILHEGAWKKRNSDCTFWLLCQNRQPVREKRREKGGREGEKVGSGDLEGREMETDEKGSPGAEVTLRTRCW